MLKLIFAAARILLGLIYFVFGWMGLLMFLGVLKMETPPMTPGAEGFFKGMMGTGYFFQFLKSTEIVCGFLLLINTAAPLALVVIAPVTIHIILFHTFLTPGVSNLGLPLAMGALQIVAMSGYMRQYRPLFS